MDSIKNKSFHFNEGGKNHLLIVEYGIRKRDNPKEAYFTVTGTLYQEVKSKSGVSADDDEYQYIDGKYYDEYTCGRIHDDIMLVTSEFNDIIALHLANIIGMPMHAFANGIYHLKNGFNNIPTTSDKFEEKFCSYYRIPLDVFDKLSDITDEGLYAITLYDNGVISKWADEAEKAIAKYQL